MHGENNVRALPESMQFTVRFETSFQQVSRVLQAALTAYKNEGHGPTMLVIQTALGKL